MKTYHIGNIVAPEERRDEFAALPAEVKESWRPASGTQEPVGTHSQYTVELPEEVAAAWAEPGRISNLRYIVEAETVEAHPLEAQGEVEASYALPDAETIRYHRADGLDASYDGSGVVVFGADTGMARIVAEKFAGKVFAGRNFTDGDAGDTEDRHGHGSGTGYMAAGTLAGVEFAPLKVLSDSGSGSSAGIVESFHYAGDYAAANPGKKVIYNGSYGSDTDDLFEPYTDGIGYATDRGVVFVLSAGNANQHILGRPANTCRINNKVFSSIAFDKAVDERASFSNYHEDGSVSAAGHREVGYSDDGRLYYLFGTSFSAPWTTFEIARLATKYELGPVLAAVKGAARNSAEPIAEEGSGVLDVGVALAKLSGGYYPELPRISKSKFDDTPLPEIPDSVVTWRRKDAGVYRRKGA
jgi:hypothetical protein